MPSIRARGGAEPAVAMRTPARGKAVHAAPVTTTRYEAAMADDAGESSSDVDDADADEPHAD